MRLLERRRPEMRASGAVVRPAKTSVLTQALVEGSGTNWKTPDVMSAIDEHEGGDFSRSGLLTQHMERDDRISACTRTRCNALTGKNGLKFTIEPAKGQGRELADRVEKWWFRVLPDATLRQLHGDAIMMGFALARVHWALDAAEWVPERVERWHPTHVRWDREAQRFAARTDDDEALIDPDDPNWLLVRPGGQDRTWMAAGVRALGLAFVMRQFTWRDWARFNEKHGMPLIVVKEPGTADDATRKAFFGSMAKMGSTGIVRVPVNQLGQGFDVGYVEAKDRSYGSFADFRRDLDIAIAVTMLGQNLTTENTGGSYAATTAHDRVRHDYLAADSEVLGTDFRAQLIMRWGRFNIRNWQDDNAPWRKRVTSIQDASKAEAEMLDKAADAIGKLQSTHMPVDYGELFVRIGLPMRQGEDPNDVEPPAPPVPVLPGQLPPNDDDDPPEPPKRKPAKPATKPPAKNLGALLASGERTPPGFLNGQLYADDLVERTAKLGGKGVSAFLVGLLDLIEAGTDYEELRRAVLAYYDDADPPDEMREVLEKALTLAELAGRHAVDEDAPDDDTEGDE